LNLAPAPPLSPRSFRPSLKSLAWIFAGWTLYGVLTANIHYVFGRSLRMKESFWRQVRVQLPEVWLWALLTLPILAAAYRFPVTRSNGEPLVLMLRLGRAYRGRVTQRWQGAARAEPN
jgi:hypothetical protein